jgi:hypothetical protein
MSSSRARSTSALVTECTPPSTYSLPSMVMGVKYPGMAHEASTAPASRARGEPSRPKTTRAPSARRTAQIRRPSGHAVAHEVVEPRARSVMSTCPRGIIVMAATSGRKAQGRWATRLISAG